MIFINHMDIQDQIFPLHQAKNIYPYSLETALENF